METSIREEGIKVLTDSSAAPSEQVDEHALRPKRLEDFLGQEATKRNLAILIQAAKERQQALEHVLFYGPPGLGKTSLAQVIATALEVPIKITSGPALERTGDLAAILTSLKPGSILFIDEIHRLARTVEEMIYPAMEDFALDLVLGKGPAAKTMRLTVPQFTLVGATTRLGSLSAPLRDRFGVHYHLDFYSKREIEEIIKRNAELLGIKLDQSGAAEIAKRSRRTPRIANRLLRRVRDYAQVHRFDLITALIADKALSLLDIDSEGLTKLDRRYLDKLVNDFQGGPLGVSTVASLLGEEPATVEEVYEPYLLREGLIQKTARGRMATTKALQKFKKS